MYLGIDIGSVSIKYALLDENFKIKKHKWQRTHGRVIGTAKEVLNELKNIKVNAIGTTGSARKFIQVLIDADYSIDEITAHRIAVKHFFPETKTIIEIGGQDSKLIVTNDLIVDFEMNSVCAAGTGSFLDQQAARLGYNIVDFYKMGMKTEKAHKIAGKCTVFAETDMIHAQQSGVPQNEIIRGLHHALVRNYFSTLGRGKTLGGRFLFEGGTADNELLIDEISKHLLDQKLIKKKDDLIIPKFNKVIGAIGAAILAKKNCSPNKRKVPQIRSFKFIKSLECYQCPNHCGATISKVKINGKTLILGKTCQN